MAELYIHSPVRFHGMVLNQLSRGMISVYFHVKHQVTQHRGRLDSTAFFHALHNFVMYLC